MAVCREGLILVAFLQCIFLCTDLHAHDPPRMNESSDQRTAFFPGLPVQCTVTKTTEGTTLDCNALPFSEILQTMRGIGNELVVIRVGFCLPITPVSLNASCFSSNTNLTDIVLLNCGVVTIAHGAFLALRHLNTLGLRSNMMSTVTTDMLAGLRHLKALELGDNLISDLTTETFVNLRKLTYLSVANNRIVRIERSAFKGLAKLEKLSLKSNIIRQIDQDAFSGLHSLDVLDLSNNDIQFFQKETFKTVENLTSLFLARNPDLWLKDYSFKDLRRLENLFLGLSNMGSIVIIEPRVFAGLRNLRHLELNGISMTPWEDSDPSDLFTDQRASLRHLDLRDTRLTNRLLEMLKNLTHVERLRLGNNDLLYIKQDSLPKVARNGSLELNNNKISYIDGDAFEGMQKESVTLRRNPLDCSCKHARFSRWLQSVGGAIVKDRDQLMCRSPIDLSETRVMDYDPYWWQCSQYMPLVALISTVGFLLIVTLVILIVYCNRINLKHWLLERRVASMPNDEEQDAEQPTESGPLLNPVLCRNALRQGKTGAYIIHDIYERHLLEWVNKYLEDQLFNHPMKITLQFPAGPEVIPLWKQVKDFSSQVNAFLVLVNDQFLANHWPEIAEKSGVENIMKCVFVLHGKKTSELPKEMKRLQCPCFRWPETGTRFTTLERERDQFWKQVRLAVKATIK